MYITEIIIGMGLVASPLLATFARLDWFFKDKNGRSTKSTFLVIGAIFSSALYSSLIFTNTPSWLITTSWAVWCTLALLSVIVYFTLHHHYQTTKNFKAQPGLLIPTALFFYIVAICSTTVMCAAVLPYKDNYIISGIIKAHDGSPTKEAFVEVVNSSKNSVGNYKVKPNENGSFFMIVPKESSYLIEEKDKPLYIKIQVRYHITENFPIENFPSNKTHTFTKK